MAVYFKRISSVDRKYALSVLKSTLDKMWKEETQSDMSGFTYYTKQEVIDYVSGKYGRIYGHESFEDFKFLYETNQKVLEYIEKENPTEEDDFDLVKRGNDLIALVDRPSHDLQKFVIDRCIYELYYLLVKDNIDISEYTQRVCLAIFWDRSMIFKKFNNEKFIKTKWFRKMKLLGGTL